VRVRCGGGGSFESTCLVVHHCLANIIHQIIEPLRVLGVVQELRNILLSCQWVQSFVDAFQFPSDPRLSASFPDLEEAELTVPTSFSSLPP